MTDTQTPNPNTVTPPIVNEELENLKKQHNDLVYKMRMTEKELLEEKNRVNTIQVELDNSNKSSIELLRLKTAYEAGIPSRFMNLITGSSKEDIDGQIKTIMESLVNTNNTNPVVTTPVSTDTSNTSNTTNTTIVTPPPKPTPLGESWLDKYSKATPEERDKMKREAQEAGKGFKIT